MTPPAIVLQGTELDAAVQRALKNVNLCQPSVADKQVGWHSATGPFRAGALGPVGGDSLLQALDGLGREGGRRGMRQCLMGSYSGRDLRRGVWTVGHLVQ